MKFRATPAFKILAAFIVGVIFLAGAALLAVAGGRMYFATTAQVERLQSAQRQNVHLRALLRAAESRAVDYLASPDGKALQAYRQSAAALDGGLTLLFNLLARVDDAEAAFVRVDTLVRARRSELDVATESRRESETVAAPALPVGVHANAEAAFNELDRAIEARIDAEATSRKESVGEMQRGIWLAIAVLIMLFSGAYAVVLGELKERRRLVRRLRSAATHDALTGLPNRRFFGEWLGYTIAQARRESAHVGLVFIDVDGPHEVLRLHKRPAFNALVAEIARRFRETAREGDLLARVGQTQFALAAPNVEGTSDFTHLAQRLRDALTDPARPPLAEVPIGASIGIAVFPNDADDTAGVIAAADAAMFAAKRAGDNRVAFKNLAEAI